MYATPTSAVGGTVQVIVTAGETTKFVTAWLADAELASLTFKLKVYVPGPVGVPVMAPVNELMLNQLGALPLTEYLYGGAPPEPVQLPVYATPTSAVSGAVQLKVKAVTTKLVTAWLADIPLLSLTFKLNV